MSSLSTLNSYEIDILDPGCGTCILSCSLVEQIYLNTKTKAINLSVYETDLKIIPFTKRVLVYLNEWLKTRNIELNHTIYSEDFILKNSNVLKENNTQEKYDIIIMNPPFFKLSKEDARVTSCARIVNGQPNIYSLFLGISVKLLKHKGEIISINPKSFTSGRYFKEFRIFFLENIRFEHIHIFNSRTDTFKKDNVLQETVIIKAIKNQTTYCNKVSITSNSISEGIYNQKEISISYKDFVDLNSSD